MAINEGLVAWVEEAMAPIGRVSRRAMMGGATPYCDGPVFAIVSADTLWFKADAVSDAEWDTAGAERFSYEHDNRPATMNYRRVPEEAYDDADVPCRCAALALAAADRAPIKKRTA